MNLYHHDDWNCLWLMVAMSHKQFQSSLTAIFGGTPYLVWCFSVLENKYSRIMNMIFNIKYNRDVTPNKIHDHTHTYKTKTNWLNGPGLFCFLIRNQVIVLPAYSNQCVSMVTNIFYLHMQIVHTIIFGGREISLILLMDTNGLI